MRSAALALAGAALACSCQARPAGEHATPRPSASTRPSGALLHATEPKHDFGHALQGDTLRHTFVLRNVTADTLAVEDTREVLGCSGVAAPRALAPGASGNFEVTCRASVYGPLRVSLPLRANGRPAGELGLAAEVEPLLAFDRPLLEVEVPFGTAGVAEAALGGARAGEARLVLLTPLPQGMAAVVLPPGRSGGQRIELRVTGAPAGVHAGSLRFSTGLEAPEEIELGYRVKVAGTLALSTTNPVLDLAAGTKALVRVTSRHPGFRVERVKVEEGPFTARARREGDAYVIEISLAPADFPRGLRGANGRLSIVSNDPAEPRKEVPLFALGSPRP